MNWIKFLQPEALPIDIVMVVLVLLAGLWQQKYLPEHFLSGALRTLLISFIFCTIYGAIISIANGFSWEILGRWFFSYVLATSLYELLLKKFLEKYFKK